MAKKKKATKEVKVDRRKPTERRTKEKDDRREEIEPVAEERRGDERRKVSRRRQIDPTTCERDYTDDEIEFMHALDDYKRTSGRMFPTCSEILEVIRKLGYLRHDAFDATGQPGPELEIEEVEATSNDEELETAAS